MVEYDILITMNGKQIKPPFKQTFVPMTGDIIMFTDKESYKVLTRAYLYGGNAIGLHVEKIVID